MTELSLTRRGCGQQSLLVAAAGVRVAQREQKFRAGREAARQGDEGQPNLSPPASEDKAQEVVTARTAPALQSITGEQSGGAWAQSVRGSLVKGKLRSPWPPHIFCWSCQMTRGCTALGDPKGASPLCSWVCAQLREATRI